MKKNTNSKHTQKILIVEDDLAYQTVLKDQLTSHGYKVIVTSCGKDGLTFAKKHHPDLILLDIKMPNMDGMTMLTELRKDTQGYTIPVIILTNIEPDDTILETVLEELPSSYLIKSDIQISELLEKIQELLTHYRSPV